MVHGDPSRQLPFELLLLPLPLLPLLLLSLLLLLPLLEFFLSFPFALSMASLVLLRAFFLALRSIVRCSLLSARLMPSMIESITMVRT